MHIYPPKELFSGNAECDLYLPFKKWNIITNRVEEEFNDSRKGDIK